MTGFEVPDNPHEVETPDEHMDLEQDRACPGCGWLLVPGEYEDGLCSSCVNDLMDEYEGEGQV